MHQHLRTKDSMQMNTHTYHASLDEEKDEDFSHLRSTFA